MVCLPTWYWLWFIKLIHIERFFILLYLSGAVELKSTFRLRNESIALRNVGLCVSLCARCVSHAVRPLHLSLRSCDIKCIPRRLFIHLFIGSVSVVTLNHHQKVVKTLFIEKDKFDYTVFIVKSKTCISFALDFWQSVRDSNTNKF